MDLNSKIYIAGHRGMVGSAIIRNLKQKGYTNLIVRTSAELDLRNSQNVNDFFATEKPDYVFLAAAKVGGIQANNLYRADFIYENLKVVAYKKECKILLSGIGPSTFKNWSFKVHV